MKKIIVFFLLVTNLLFSQKQICGQVLDFDTNVPIAFAKITYNNKEISTNWEGKFCIENASNKKPILINYKGYLEKTYYLPEKRNFLLIKMTQKENAINDEIYSESIVNQVIKNIIANRDMNNIEKSLKDFEYKNHEVATFSANPDSISEKIDTIYKHKFFGAKKMKLDSTNYKFKRFIEKQHIYQTEKVNLIQHNKKGAKETVIASRMAGFKKPIYEYLGLKLVPYSLYNQKLIVFETPIKNPISRQGRSFFTYKIIDTLTIENRKVYSIYFQPKKLKSNNLRGLLFVDAQNYGIAKAFYRIYGIVNINATYTFNYLKDENIWFPEKRVFTIIKGENSEDISILGGTIKFTSAANNRLKNDASDNVYLKLESKSFDIKINKQTNFKDKYIKIDVPESGLSKPDSFWRSFSNDTVDVRKLTTYTSLDSLSQAENIEKKLFFGRKIINGYIPISFFDLDLRHVIKYNNWEGFRLGIGGVTNDKLSEKYKIGGYLVYGLKDEAIKFGITPSYAIDRKTNSWLNFSYIEDLSEIGQIQFYTQNKRFKIYDPRPFNIPTFYNHKTYNLFVESKFIPKTEGYFGVSKSAITPLFEYSFINNGKKHDIFNLTTIDLSLQWNPFSDYMQTPLGRIEINKLYPKLNFQATKAIKNVLDGDFDFIKIEAKATYDIPYLSGQLTSIVLQAGFGFGDIPITHLYSVAPNNLNKNSFIKRINFAGKNSFETMFYNEFFSSNYTVLHLRHMFNKIKIAYSIKPTLSVVTRMAYGTLGKKNQHAGRSFNTLEKGYFESGAELNKIYKGFGLGAYYRYGAYGLPAFADNIAIKVSFNFDLGF